MTRSSKRYRDRQRQRLDHFKLQSTAGLALICGLCYGLAGLSLTRLPYLAWLGLWPLGLLAAWLQVWGLTQPSPLKFQGISLTQLGTGLLTAALAASLNYLGSAQIDDVTFSGLILQILACSGLGLVLALVCKRLTVLLADRLQIRLSDDQTRALLTTVLGLGLILGGLAGLLLKLI